MRKYKIIRIAGIHYATAMRAFSFLNPALKFKPYAEQQKTLFEQGYTYGDSFSRAMRHLGHQAEEIVYDLEPLQKTWAKEHGTSYRPTHWQWDILLAQIENLRPEIVFFQDLHSLPFSIRAQLKDRFPFLKLVVVFRGFPGTSPQLFKELAAVDLLLVGSPILKSSCEQRGLRPHLIYHYFDDSLLGKLGLGQDKKYNFTFIGSSGFGYGQDHEPRYTALRELLTRSELEIWADEEGQTKFRSPKQIIQDFLRRAGFQILEQIPQSIRTQIRQMGRIPQKLKNAIDCIENKNPLLAKPLRSLFPNQCHSAVFGLEMYQLLYESKITFNKHTAPAAGTVDNIRLFQATGVGTCLVTDDGDNMSDLFERDREVVTYRSIDECLEKVRYLLNNDQTRQSIALQGQKRTLRQHTSIERCKQIDALFQQALKET